MIAEICGSDQISSNCAACAAPNSVAIFRARIGSWSHTDVALTSSRVLTRLTNEGVWIWATPTKATVIFFCSCASADGTAAAATVTAAAARMNWRRLGFCHAAVSVVGCMLRPMVADLTPICQQHTARKWGD